MMQVVSNVLTSAPFRLQQQASMDMQQLAGTHAAQGRALTAGTAGR